MMLLGVPIFYMVSKPEKIADAQIANDGSVGQINPESQKRD